MDDTTWTSPDAYTKPTEAPPNPTPAHERLKITADEYLRLMAVREALSDGKLQHTRAKYFRPKAGFSMDHWDDDGKFCGTCACIGGWMGLKEHDESDALIPLFYPALPRPIWKEITPAQAVRAIDNFIATGEPDWLRVVPG